MTVSKTQRTEVVGSGGADRIPLFALFAANTVSLIGNVLTAIAVPWFVLQTTGSPARTGIVAFFTTLPVIVSGIFGGTIVDRVGHKRMSVMSDVASGVTVAMIPLLFVTIGLEFWYLLVLVFVSQLLDAPGGTARQSILPDLVGAAGMPLERANAIYGAIQRSSMFFGPVIAGLLIAWLGASNVLWVDAATFAVSALLIAALVPAPARPATAAERMGYGAELAEGFRFIWRDRLVFSLLVVFAISNFLTAPMFPVIFPVYADTILGGALDLGLMISGFGGGALAGAILYGILGPRLSRRAALLGALAIATLPLFVLAALPALVLAVGALVMMGLAAGPINPIAMTILQERTPAEMRGRVFGMVTATAWIAMPAGMLVAGLLLETIGLQPTLIGIAVLSGMLAVAMLINPASRDLD